MQQRFPLRTLVLMILALASFAWFYWNTHQASGRPPPQEAREVEVLPAGGDR